MRIPSLFDPIPIFQKNFIPGLARTGNYLLLLLKASCFLGFLIGSTIHLQLLLLFYYTNDWKKINKIKKFILDVIFPS
jgi:hypothetical protein